MPGLPKTSPTYGGDLQRKIVAFASMVVQSNKPVPLDDPEIDSKLREMARRSKAGHTQQVLVVEVLKKWLAKGVWN